MEGVMKLIIKPVEKSSIILMAMFKYIIIFMSVVLK